MKMLYTLLKALNFDFDPIQIQTMKGKHLSGRKILKFPHCAILTLIVISARRSVEEVTLGLVNISVFDS